MKSRNRASAVISRRNTKGMISMDVESLRKRRGDWTLDDIADAVLNNDDISISLTEAILSLVDECRAYLSQASGEGGLREGVATLRSAPQVQDGAIPRVAKAISTALERYALYGYSGNRPSAVHDEDVDPALKPTARPVFTGMDEECIAFIHEMAAKAALEEYDAFLLEGFDQALTRATAPVDVTEEQGFCPGRGEIE